MSKILDRIINYIGTYGIFKNPTDNSVTIDGPLKLENNTGVYIKDAHDNYQQLINWNDSDIITLGNKPVSLTGGQLLGITTVSNSTDAANKQYVDNRTIDYVIEEHIATTDTNWSWRKWNSGIAECWKRFYSGTFAPNFTLGGGFYARVLGPFELPSGLFTTIPFGNFDFTYWGNTYFWGSLRSVTATDYSLTVFKYGNESHIGRGSLYFIGT